MADEHVAVYSYKQVNYIYSASQTYSYNSDIGDHIEMLLFFTYVHLNYCKICLFFFKYVVLNVPIAHLPILI